MPAKLPTHRPRRPSDATARDQGNQRQRSRFLHTGSAQWRAIRKAQLERFPLCEDCGAPAMEVDHNTDDTSRNVIGEELSSLCKPCHSKRSRERQSGRTRRIPAGTLALLADVAVRYPGHEIEVISAVRSEPDRSRAGIPHSRHWDGRAIDLQVRGAKLSEVRDVMWKTHRHLGLGWYPEAGFIHLDYRPDMGDTAWTQPRPNTNNIYNPRWSRVTRDL